MSDTPESVTAEPTDADVERVARAIWDADRDVDTATKAPLYARSAIKAMPRPAVAQQIGLTDDEIEAEVSRLVHGKYVGSSIDRMVLVNLAKWARARASYTGPKIQVTTSATPQATMPTCPDCGGFTLSIPRMGIQHVCRGASDTAEGGTR